jgi:hypothetical protein
LKKVLSILLLVIFLFNVGGYYIVFWGLRFQADQQLAARLDANLYRADETIEIKIPVSLPYPVQEQGFQRIGGKFEYGGEYFQFIKSKYQGDTLYVVCIRDHEVKQLETTMTDYVRLANALPGSANKALNLLGKLIKEFCSQDTTDISHNYGYSMTFLFGETCALLPAPVIRIQAPPPRV